MKTQKKTKISLKEVVKKPLFLVPVSIIGFLFICSLSLVIWKPGIVKGEYSIQSIVDMLLNHEERISNLETKTDETQTQTNQNTEDVKKLQDTTGTQPANPVDPVQTPVAKVPVPKDETPVIEDPEPEPADPNNNSWETANGTFVYKDYLTASRVYLGKPLSIYSPTCSRVTLPIGTVGYKHYNQIPGLTAEFINRVSMTYPPKNYALIFDIRGKCGNYYTWQIPFSSDVANSYFAGVYDLWW